jgi:hypothetical protein
MTIYTIKIGNYKFEVGQDEQLLSNYTSIFYHSRELVCINRDNVK